MEIVKIKGNEKEALFELRGETFTLASLLEEELWENKNVLEAASFREHPYLSEVKLWVKVDKGNVKEALVKAAESIIEKIGEIRKNIKNKL
ncbi:MAG: RpoL/Rpb11 RNA polymerase subunit family protein [Candidatus Aenigmatarchaeota archaeon]